MSGKLWRSTLWTFAVACLFSLPAAAYVEVHSLPAPAKVLAIRYSPAYGMLAVNAGDSVQLVRLQDGLQYGFPANATFTDISLSPNGRFLFAADYGGELIGYSQPLHTSYVHRHDLATNFREYKAAHIAGRVQALSDTRLVLSSLDQGVTYTCNDWAGPFGSPLMPQNAAPEPFWAPGYYAYAYQGDFRYSAATGRLIHGNGGGFPYGVIAYELAGCNFVPKETSPIDTSTQPYGGSVVLSSDGLAFYHGPRKVDAADLTRTLMVFPEIIHAATATVAFGNGKYYDANTGQLLGTLGFATTVYGIGAGSDDVWAYDAQAGLLRHLVAPPAGGGAITVNGYGPLAVTGATLSGTTLTNFSSDVAITLGSVTGALGAFLEIDLDGLPLGPGQTLTFKAGGKGQVVVLNDTRGTGSVVAGTLRAAAGNGEAAPVLYLRNPAGLTVIGTGVIDAPSGLALDLRNSVRTSGVVTNQGWVNGGTKLHVSAGKITGGGTLRGDDITIATEGNANNTVDPVDFMRNGLNLAPASGDTVALRVSAYGTQPQFLNLHVLGNATFAMAPAWSGDLPLLLPLPKSNSPIAGYPIFQADQPYGGGSLLMQVTGSLTMDGGYVANAFVFPGGIALVAGGTLDINAVRIDNGWSTGGKPFQGLFFEAPVIKSTNGNINLTVSNLNWVNFSTRPTGTAVWPPQQVRRAPDGSIFTVYADGLLHINTYSQITAIAAAGGCWVCAVDPTPVILHP